MLLSELISARKWEKKKDAEVISYRVQALHDVVDVAAVEKTRLGIRHPASGWYVHAQRCDYLVWQMYDHPPWLPPFEPEYFPTIESALAFFVKNIT